MTCPSYVVESILTAIHQCDPKELDPELREHTRQRLDEWYSAVSPSDVNADAYYMALAFIVAEELRDWIKSELPAQSVAAECRRFARKMFAGVSSLLSEDVADGPLPPNLMNATCHNGSFTVYVPPTRRMTPEEALNLGVWLIALADPALEHAPALLLKVATRQ